MKKAFMPQMVQCNNCKLALQIQPTICLTESQMQHMASDLHSNSKLICGRPELILIYVNALGF